MQNSTSTSRLLMAAGSLVLLILATLVTPAQAALGGQAVVNVNRVVVTITGAKPTKATLVVGGTAYRLARSGTTWRTKPLKASVLAKVTGKKAKVKVTVKGTKRVLRTTIKAQETAPPPQAPGTPQTPGAPGTPGTPGTGTPGTGTSPLFAAPGVDREGQEAWDAIKGYFANSTMTNCPQGWPACAVEWRYGFFENGTIASCRLQSVSGGDITSYYDFVQVTGVSQYADGSWGVSFLGQYRAFSEYNPSSFAVIVGANGVGEVRYWSPGVDPATQAPSDRHTDLLWMRGAKDCSY